MAVNKTAPTPQSVDAFLDGVEPERRREDGRALKALFDRATGWEAAMWGPSMVGYGRYAYTYDSGHSGEFFVTGFSPRKAALSIYILPGCTDHGTILGRLGKWSKGKSCLYVKTLADIDLAVLEELIAAGVADMASKYEIRSA
jgi:hypothetical protein